MVVKTKDVDCGAREVDRGGSGCAPWRGLQFLGTEFLVSAARHLFAEHVIEYTFFCYPKGINASNIKNFSASLARADWLKIFTLNRKY